MKNSKLKIFRNEQKLSQVQMAKALGVSLSMYEKVERGYIKASRNFMEKLKKNYPTLNIEEIFFDTNSI